MSRTKLKTKRIADFPKPFRDALGYWSALRDLGFDADEIFFGFGEVNGVPDHVYLQLKTQGKEFTITVAQIPGANFDAVISTWQDLCDVTSRSTQDERVAGCADHLLRNADYFATMVQAIQAKSIVVPELAHLSPHAGQA